MTGGEQYRHNGEAKACKRIRRLKRPTTIRTEQQAAKATMSDVRFIRSPHAIRLECFIMVNIV
jgi:hypothetical protein